MQYHDIISEPFKDTIIGHRLRAYATEGYPYAVDEAELHLLQSSRVGPQHPDWRDLPPIVDMKQAFDRLASPHDERNPKWQAALQRFKQVMSDPRHSYDLPMKMFNDLDTLLFQGDLQRRVNVKWESLSAIGLASYGHQPDRVLAITMPPASWSAPRVKIRLNADIDWAPRPKKVVIGALVHEMLHSYYFIHCGVVGYQDVVNGPGMDHKHGFFFTLAAEMIEVKTGLNLFAGEDSPNR